MQGSLVEAPFAPIAPRHINDQPVGDAGAQGQLPNVPVHRVEAARADAARRVLDGMGAAIAPEHE